MEERIKLVISIVNRNLAPRLKACLTSIYQTRASFNFEVYVVDNASRDESVKMVKENFPEVKLIENKENFYYARANNQVLRKVLERCEYFMILNNDTRVLNNAISKLVNFMDTAPRVGIAGPQLVDEGGRIQLSCAPFPNLKSTFQEYFFARDTRYSQEAHREYFEPEVICGAALMVRAAAIKEVGLMEARYRMYCEEVDWCWRMHQRGWRVAYFPEAKIIHYQGESSKPLEGILTRQLERSRILYYRFHHGITSSLLASLIIHSSKLRLLRRIITKLHSIFSTSLIPHQH